MGNDMRLTIDTTTGAERPETRTEILTRHARMEARGLEGSAFLESLHTGDHFDAIAKENREADQRDFQDALDQGLTTEINTSTKLMPVADIVERCQAILARHPFGYRKGDVSDEADADVEQLMSQKAS